MKKSKRRMIWAVDPFEANGKVGAHVISTVRELLVQGVEIEPVYVLSPYGYETDIEFYAPAFNQIRSAAEKTLVQFIGDAKVPGVMAPHIIIERSPSKSRSTRALVAYAKASNAISILVGTHGRKGLSRLFLGSFAETLLLKSKIPVLVVGPESQGSSKTKARRGILFSTDFGPSSSPTFQRVLALAKARRAPITLFYRLPHPVEPFVQSGVSLLGGGYVALPEYLTHDERRKRRKAARYAAMAKKHGVEVEIVFENGYESTAQAIIDRAQKDRSSLITMAAESGPVSAALIGSIARQVVRSAPCPVWILRASGGEK